MDGEASSRLEQMVRDALRAEVGDKLDELRRFVDRRCAELSAEIHATVELVDFSETNLSGQLGRIQEQVARVVAAPQAQGSGLELEEIVHATERAANRIMDAAEAIEAVLGKIGNKQIRATIAARIRDIYETCSFQDLTSQRVRRAVEHLAQVEAALREMASGEPRQGAEPRPPAAKELPGPSLSQDEVDRLLS